MDPYECHIEAHRIPAPTQLVSLVSRDCRNSYLRLPFAIFFFGTSPCFPPFNGRDLCVRWLFSSKVQLLLRPPPMRPPIMRLDRWRRWIQGELLPFGPKLPMWSCGASWLTNHLVFSVGEVSRYPSQRDVTCRHAIVSYATIPSN